MNPILGPNSLHWASKLLKTHYRQFNSPLGIDGLAKESDGGKTLHLLAVHAQSQGQGSFRNFITEAKKYYTKIAVWEIANVILEDALERYGFSQTEETHYGEKVKGMVWKPDP